MAFQQREAMRSFRQNMPLSSATKHTSSANQDWRYVDTWLGSHFSGTQIPEFERNEDTLNALLSLAALNESAEEHRRLVADTKRAELRDLGGRPDIKRAADETNAGIGTRELLLEVVESELSREGTIALEGLTSFSITAFKAGSLGFSTKAQQVADARSSLTEAQQMAERAKSLNRAIQQELLSMNQLCDSLKQVSHSADPSLAKQNRNFGLLLQENESKLITMSKSAAIEKEHSDCNITIDHLVQHEQEYLALMSHKRRLDAQLAAFEGLPPDPERAKSELANLRTKLEGVTYKRDAAFEGLVQRESPAKR